MKAAVVLLSGGLDSLVALAECISRHGSPAVIALTFCYGQKHGNELTAARRIVAHYEVEQVEAEFYFLLDHCGGSALLRGGPSLPDAAPDAPEQAATIIPYRNGGFISMAAMLALARGAREVWFGANADDAAVYPDCTRAFWGRQRWALESGTAGAVTLIAPHLERTKADVVQVGRRLGVPLELSWSCYAGGARPCGKCGACRARKEAGA